MKAEITTYPDRSEVRVDLLALGLETVEGGAEIVEVRDEAGEVESRTAVWTLGPDLDAKKWAKTEVKPLLASPDVEDDEPTGSATVSL